MSLFEIVILSIVQGIAEFLPISSSGHLKIIEHFFGINEPLTLFDVSLHVGSLLAVLVYLRKEIFELLKGIFKIKPEQNSLHLLLLIIFASIPTAIIGFTFGDFTESKFSSITAIGILLIINSIILIIPLFHGKLKHGRLKPSATLEGTSFHNTSFFTAFIIGIAQGIGILRGISRSGITITTGILAKMNGDAACRFSFLISIPAIIGALILHLSKNNAGSVLLQPWEYIIGSAIAFAVGYFAISILFISIRKGALHLYAPYCAVVGILVLIFA